MQSTKHGGSEYPKTSDSIHQAKQQYQSVASEEVSGVPAMEEFIRPVLQWVSKQQGEFAPREAIDAMANHFNLSAKARDEHQEGKVKFYECTTWSISHLKYAGLLQRMGRARYEITDAGRKEAFFSSEVMTKAYLADNFPTYRIERDRASRKNKEDTRDN